MQQGGGHDSQTSQAMPPTSNKGAEPTDGLLIDWLSWTLPCSQARAFFERFPWDSQQLDHGAMGYSHSAVILAHGRKFWNPRRPEMGVHYSLGAQALAQVDDLAGLMESVLELGGHFCRLDLAMDSSDLDMERILGKLERGEYLSRWKGYAVVYRVAHTENGSQVGGKTIYFGSRGSRMFARLYDKAAERRSKGLDVDGNLIRFEIEAKKDRADALAGLVLAHDWDTLLGVFRGYLTFLEPQEGDSNKSRWQVSAWWDAFLQGVATVRGFFAGAATKTLGDVVSWVRRQVAPSLALLLEWAQGDMAVILDMAAEGKQRWRPRHRAMLAMA